MKADELMVGDIVLRKGKPVEIVSTSGIEYSFGQQDITIYQGKGNGLESHTMRGIAPMRITERLLVALLFFEHELHGLINIRNYDRRI